MFVGIVAFIVISTVSLFSALGYRMNWSALTIQQTGLIEVQTSYALPVNVYLNNIPQEGTLPLRLNGLFPGDYTIRVEEEGYQPWQRTVTVQPNQRAVFRSIVLVYATPKLADVPVVRTTDFLPSRDDLSGITIKRNELWLDNVFITRTSEDIWNARWFPGKNQVLYQAGNRLLLVDKDGYNSQVVLTTKNDAPIPYTLQDNGRLLIYQEAGVTKAVTLFDQVSLIDRLAGARSTPGR